MFPFGFGGTPKAEEKGEKSKKQRDVYKRQVLNLFFITGEGEPLVHFGFIHIYREGVSYAVLMAVRIVALIAGTSLCLLYTSRCV